MSEYSLPQAEEPLRTDPPLDEECRKFAVALTEAITRYHLPMSEEEDELLHMAKQGFIPSDEESKDALGKVIDRIPDMDVRSTVMDSFHRSIGHGPWQSN